jgi:hypothetical protein
VSFPDVDILERRLRQLERLPWPLPAMVLLEMTDEDFDMLDMARDEDAWWGVLNRVVTRIESGERRADKGGAA